MIRAMSYGAVLWDIAEGEKHLGGCTLNLIAHLKKLGMNSYMYTKLGTDKMGEEAVKGIESLGVNTSFVQVDHSKNTGYAKITFNEEKVPAYKFAENASHEFIEAADDTIERLKREEIDLFCYGTYCQSGEVTRKNLMKILDTCSFPLVFCDINLRVENPPKEMLEGSLRHADILKLNDDEVVVLDRVLFSNALNEGDFVKKLQEVYGIKIVCITKGKFGCSIYDENGVGMDVPAKKIDVVDTVGAGDAFGAGFIYSYYKGLPLVKCGENGNLLGGYVASQKGAIPEYSEEIIKHFEE